MDKIARFDLLAKIADRAATFWPESDLPRMRLMMDLDFSDVDLARLAGFEDGDFRHDIAGITRHMDRDVCRLDGMFVPRAGLVGRSSHEVLDGFFRRDGG